MVANVTAEDIGVRTRVRDPAGEVIWEAEDRISSLGPGGDRELVYSVPLGRAAPGDYRVELAVDDASGDRAAEDVAHFQVRSTAESGVGLAGEVDVSPEPVLRTERLDLLGRIVNEGNAAVEDLPAELLVVDGETGDTLTGWSYPNEDLATDADRLLTEAWDAVVPRAGGMYSAVLRTVAGGEARTLAHQWFTILEKLEWRIGDNLPGRVLFLVDGPERIPTGEACEGADELELAIAPPLALRPGDHVRAVLYDEAGGELSVRESRVDEFESRWAKRGETGGHLALSRVDRGRVQVALMNLHDIPAEASRRLAVEVDGEDGPRQWSSDYFSVDCGEVPQGGYGDFRRIAAWGPDAADPHGPRNAPTLAHQRRHLESVLRAAGWSYRIVTDADDLAAAVETGEYNAYALHQEHEKLPEPLQQRLVEAAEAGAGLLVAGRHDQRSGRLEPALGLTFRGRLPHADGVDVTPHEGFEGGSEFFATTTKPLRVHLTGAEPVATFTQAAPGGGNNRGGGDEDDGEPAVTYHTPGDGAAGHIGFDILAEATAAEGAYFDDLLLAALTRIAADRGEAGYGPLQRLITLQNLGEAAAGHLLIPAVEEVSVVDPASGRLTDDGGLKLVFQLEAEGSVAIPLWISAAAEAPETLDALLRIETTGGAMVDYGTIAIPLR